MHRAVDRPTNSIFQEAWWLDAVAPGRWEAVELRDGGGLKAWMPLVFMDAPGGLRRCDMPPLTQTLGPWLAPQATPKYWKALGKQQSALNALIEQLPDVDLFRQNLHWSTPTAMPFAQAGYDLRLAYTYVIEDLANAWNTLSDERRRVVRRARERIEVVETDDVELFWRLNLLTYARQDARPPYTRELFYRLNAACAANDARRIFVARDEKQDHAAVYVVHNEAATYYLAGGADPTLTKAGGTSLALWQAIEFAQQNSKVFDFEGSMMKGVEHFFRSFGGTQMPYVGVSRRSTKMRVASGAREALRVARSRLRRG